jgi:5-carboxymethyl-2-hydroxymuconate isomerase
MSLDGGEIMLRHVMKIEIEATEPKWTFDVEIFNCEVLHTAHAEEPKPFMTLFNRVGYGRFDDAIKEVSAEAIRIAKDHMKTFVETYSVIIRPKMLAFNIQTKKS